MEYRFCLEEMETHLFRDAIDKCWIAETNIAMDYRRFKKQGWEVVKEEFYEDGSFKSAVFRARYEAIKVGPAKKRELSDEQKEVLRERMNAARAKKS